MSVICPLLLSFLVSAGAEQKKEWYEGGTLHRKSALEWSKASHADRLATASDFTAKVTKPKSMSELKDKAVAMERCISTVAAPSTKNPKQPVAEIASACSIILGYVAAK
jgi:hypothetical protein